MPSECSDGLAHHWLLDQPQPGSRTVDGVCLKCSTPRTFTPPLVDRYEWRAYEFRVSPSDWRPSRIESESYE